MLHLVSFCFPLFWLNVNNFLYAILRENVVTSSYALFKA
ncbi:hypothetical protein GFS31_38680 [Leptolyngbya sp. BL0902]|nr:hypothetical protein GFS31_38680 [Leptolyngbya sp. BL0902]